MSDSEEELVSDPYGSDEGYSFGGSDPSDGSGGEDDYGFALQDEETGGTAQALYTVLSESEIARRQTEAVSNISSLLSVSPSQTVNLLRHFKWDSNRLTDEWFEDSEKVSGAVGLVELFNKATVSGGPPGPVQCGICFEELPGAETHALSCEHFYCAECWRGYILNAIGDGAGCLNLRCPLPTCATQVEEEFMAQLVGEEDLAKYRRFKLRSYVEDNGRIKWCPGTDCNLAVECTEVEGEGAVDVTCGCGHKFCYGCMEEAHRPVDCGLVRKWILKNTAESENLNWILANSKPCPKCKRPIEKNQGCMHMVCSAPCKFEFCWLCLGSWAEHGERTGGFYACNRFEASKGEGKYDEETKKRKMAKESLERYTHFYERWAAHEKARAKAQDELLGTTEDTLRTMSEFQKTPVSQLKFVTDAMEQVVQCRRILKWTYAYGFYKYLSPEEAGLREFFEYQQARAEICLEGLHEETEKKMQHFLVEGREKGSPDEFNEFRCRLTGLTVVTRDYFESLVRALERGLDSLHRWDANSGVL
eukprot:CAMPEP_0182861762 /NCGR_PEP_ID=MMETSP0034_2-20130328/5672_1 /TAXON_ID=156128 /ORGANISM="Nephroselmis pyriformis, Strain CCMP717" /LENGTH=532 /DNA_ID=CAMNT_0024993727 /DNA_START=163 /DNA_END=1761 /DNA_ORIENTATION=-